MAASRYVYRDRFCPSGPGTELSSALARWGFREKEGCGCKRYAAIMNIRGPKWCENHMPAVLNWLRRSAHERKLPFSEIVAKQFVTRAIRRSREHMEWKDIFERVYCITLKRRRDRWERFVADTPADWPFGPIIRVEAIDGQRVKAPGWWKAGNGAWGCYRSHLRLIEQCLNEGVQSVLLLEDDAICCDDFAARANEYLSALPQGWRENSMVYFGGQHLAINRFPPERINPQVFQPYNVNRTHAFALFGRMIQTVYTHLTRGDWQKAQHIDHHLGRFHQRRKDPIYTPAEWLIGQAAGKSNISGRIPPDRFWKPAASIAAVDPQVKPFVAVVGLHSSGSSATAGVLYHLGVHLGNELAGFYGKDPDKSCGFEAVGLMRVCQTAIPLEASGFNRGPKWIRNNLGRFINEKRREAEAKGTVAGGKHPLLCRMGPQLQAICRDQLHVLHIDRPLEESIASLLRRTGNAKTGSAKIEGHMRWLNQGKQAFLAVVPSERRFDLNYADLLADPVGKVNEIVQWLAPLGLDPTPEQIAKAVAYVDPNKRHIRIAATVEAA